MSDISATRPSVLPALMLPVASVLRSRGFDPIEEMLDVGIDAAKIVRPDWRVPLKDYDSLLDRCVELTQEDALGLFAGEALQPQYLSALGLGWLASDSVYDGLRRLVRFCRLVSSITELRLVESDEFIELELYGTALIHQPNFTRHDYGIAMVVKMCQMNLGEFLAPVMIEMARPEPRNPERWESMLATRIAFGCKRNSIKWARADVQDKLASGDPILARINDEQTEAYIDTFLGDTTSQSVVRKIVSRLPDGPPDQQQIADDLCVSNRTLQRKLKDEGTSYNDLLQDTRLQLASKYLRQKNRSVVEITYLLGFSEPSAFSRAFKRWTGQSPGSYQATA